MFWLIRSLSTHVDGGCSTDPLHSPAPPPPGGKWGQLNSCPFVMMYIHVLFHSIFADVHLQRRRLLSLLNNTACIHQRVKIGSGASVRHPSYKPPPPTHTLTHHRCATLLASSATHTYPRSYFIAYPHVGVHDCVLMVFLVLLLFFFSWFGRALYTAQRSFSLVQSLRSSFTKQSWGRKRTIRNGQ